LKASKTGAQINWRKFSQSKEIKMVRNRLFNVSIAIALIIVIAFTVREAAATAAVVSQASSAMRSSVECASLPSRYSIHSEYVEAGGVWVTYTEDGPTGVDGGLVDLLASYRTCSQ
jgi:hypothetical protein